MAKISLKQACGEIELSGKKMEHTDRCEVDAMILHPGSFDSMSGQVNVTSDDVHKLARNYNSTVNTLWENLKSKILGSDVESDVALKASPVCMKAIDEVDHAPVQVDHDMSNFNTVGRLVGLLKVEDRHGLPHLMGKFRILGEDNVKRVKDGRFKNISLGFNDETHEIHEVSFVTWGAVQDASILGKKGEEPVKIEESQTTETTQETVSEPTPLVLENIAAQVGAPPANATILHVVATSGGITAPEGGGCSLQQNVEANTQLAQKDAEFKKLQATMEARKGQVRKLASLRAEIVELQSKENALLMLSKLEKQGRITPAQLRGGIVDEIINRDKDSREFALQLLGKVLSSQVDFGVKSQNLNANKLYETVNKYVELAADGEYHVKLDKLEAGLGQFVRNLSSKEAGAAQDGTEAHAVRHQSHLAIVPDADTQALSIHRDNLSKLHAMLEKGEYDDAKKQIKCMLGEEDSEEELSGNQELSGKQNADTKVISEKRSAVKEQISSLSAALKALEDSLIEE